MTHIPLPRSSRSPSPPSSPDTEPEVTLRAELSLVVGRGGGRRDQRVEDRNRLRDAGRCEE